LAQGFGNLLGIGFGCTIMAPMQVFARCVSGQSLCLQQDGLSTVADIKAKVSCLDGVPTEDQVITFAGRVLEDGMTLVDAGVEEESTLFVTSRLDGGGKKRKKKVYTTPKKIKHKRKKVKLATLKFYKVDGQNKVQRLRKVCPSELCGDGVFMAAHRNRHYCGRCGVTYQQDE